MIRDEQINPTTVRDFSDSIGYEFDRCPFMKKAEATGFMSL